MLILNYSIIIRERKGFQGNIFIRNQLTMHVLLFYRQVEQWLSWIPIVFGSTGSFGGGYLSDRLSSSRGTSGRLLVLIGCLVS